VQLYAPYTREKKRNKEATENLIVKDSTIDHVNLFHVVELVHWYDIEDEGFQGLGR